MKTFCLLMVLAAGSVFAGSGVVVQERYSSGCAICVNCEACATCPKCRPSAPRIPQPIMQGIKDLAVQRNPTHPDDQVAEVTDGLNAWLALQGIPNTPEKESAAKKYPFDFAKQLYLAQRPFQN